MTLPELNMYAEAMLELAKRISIPLEETESSKNLANDAEEKLLEIKSKLNYAKSKEFENLGFNKIGKVKCNLDSAINFIEKSLNNYKEFVRINKKKRVAFDELRRVNKEAEQKRIAELKKERLVRDKVKDVVKEEIQKEKRKGNPAFRKGFPNPYKDKSE